MVETCNMIVLSTAHLSEKTNSLMLASEESAHLRFIYYPKGEYGWFMPVLSAEMQHFIREDGFEDVALLQAWARARGFDYIMFDRDADAISELPTYEW